MRGEYRIPEDIGRLALILAGVGIVCLIVASCLQDTLWAYIGSTALLAGILGCVLKWVAVSRANRTQPCDLQAKSLPSNSAAAEWHIPEDIGRRALMLTGVSAFFFIMAYWSRNGGFVVAGSVALLAGIAGFVVKWFTVRRAKRRSTDHTTGLPATSSVEDDERSRETKEPLRYQRIAAVTMFLGVLFGALGLGHCIPPWISDPLMGLCFLFMSISFLADTAAGKTRGLLWSVEMVLFVIVFAAALMLIGLSIAEVL